MNDSQTTEEKLQAWRNYLPHACMGTQNYYLCMGYRFTDGVRFFTETFDAFWLVALIISWQPKIQRRLEHMAERDMQFWIIEELDVSDHFEATPGKSIRVSAWTDTPHQSVCLATQDIPWTDLPRELLPFDHLWVEHGVLYVKEER